jgi:hypothetical protein
MGLDACWARGRRWTLPRRPATDRASPDGNARARTVSAGALVAVAIVLVGVLEVSAVPQRLFTVEDPVTDWAIWLRDHPGAPDGGDTGEGTVAMVPFPATGAVASYEPTAQWMLSGLDHGHALVNGYSGLFPPQYDQLEADMVTFPDPDSLASLRRRGVSFVVVTDGWFTPDRRDQLRSSAAFSLRFTGGGASVYQLLR